MALHRLHTGWLGFILASFMGLAQAESGRWVIHDTRNLPGKEVRAIVVDRFGNKWIGTNGGLARLTLRGKWTAFTRQSTKGGLKSDSITCMMVDVNDAVWIGTDGGGLSTLKDGVWRTYDKEGTAGGLPDNRITAVASGPSREIWVWNPQRLRPARRQRLDDLLLETA